MDPIAVVGASGHLGRAICAAVARTSPVVRCVRSPVDERDVEFDFWSDDLAVSLHDRDVRTVVFCARVHPASPAEHSARGEAYTAAVSRMVRACRERRLVLASTDAVFDGTRGGYRETDPPRPVTAYGESALAFERAASELDDVCIVRLSYVYGYSDGALDRRLTKAVDAARHGVPHTVYADMYRSPIHVDDAAGAIAELAWSEVSGVIHAGGRRMSVAAFHRMALAALGVDDHHLDEQPLPAGSPIQRDTSLHVARLFETTGVRPRPVTALSTGPLPEAVRG